MQKLIPVNANKIRKLLETVETWLTQNALPLALIIIAIGLGFRIYYAAACYLNPDEAIHVALAQASGLKEAYLQSRTQAHPPLLTMALYFILKFGSSEFLVRLPSLIGSTLGAWFGVRWAERVFGTGAAIGMLLVLTFSPAMAFTAIEVRQYGLLIMGVCGALYGLERAFDQRSWKWMAFGYLWLYAAILSHYSALWITVTISCYGILRLYKLRAKRQTWMVWGGFQAGAALLYMVLYFTHVKYMRSGWMYDYAVNTYLKDGYFHGGEQSLFEFFGSGLLNVFSYLSGLRLAGSIGLALFVTAVIALLVIPATPEGGKRRDLSLLLGMPLVLGYIGALMHFLPFLGTRHISYLLPFLAVGLSFSVFRWVKYKAIAAVLLCLIGPAWLMWSMAGPGMIPNNHPEMLPREEMARALEFLSAEVPADRPLIVDYQTSLELQYYLGNNGPVRLEMKSWAFDRKNFMPFVHEAGDKLGVKPGERLWAMSTRWYDRPPLIKAVPKQLLVRAEQFGQISLVQFKMPPESSKGKQEKGEKEAG
ncbi:MAG: glycosyltransferase family 39 protein [Acidobacteriota bacterium]